VGEQRVLLLGAFEKGSFVQVVLITVNHVIMIVEADGDCFEVSALHNLVLVRTALSGFWSLVEAISLSAKEFNVSINISWLAGINSVYRSDVKVDILSLSLQLLVLY